MQRWRYKAWDEEGKTRIGLVEAVSHEAARRQVEAQGLRVNYVKPTSKSTSILDLEMLEAPPPRPRWPRFLAGGLALALLLVGFIAYWQRPASTDPEPTPSPTRTPVPAPEQGEPGIKVQGKLSFREAEEEPSLVRLTLMFDQQSLTYTLTDEIRWFSDGRFEALLPLRQPLKSSTFDVTVRYPDYPTLRRRRLPLGGTRDTLEARIPPLVLSKEKRKGRRGRVTRLRARQQDEGSMLERLRASVRR